MANNSNSKESIVHAAMELFREKGYSGVTVRDICASSGVPSSSFYTVFSGKDDILVHVLKGQKDNFEDTMLELLAANSSLEKLWVLYNKYLCLAESFGPELTVAMFELELKRKFSFIAPVNDYIRRYSNWLVRLVEDCQASGVIQNPGKADELVPMAVRLSFYILLEWCVSKEAYSFTERAFTEMESFYIVREDCRGQWKKLFDDAT